MFAEQRPEAEAVLRSQAPAAYTFSRDWPIADLAMDARGSRFRLRGVEVVCPLAGEHQVENARVAAIALAELGVSPAELPLRNGQHGWRWFPSGRRSSSMARTIPLERARLPLIFAVSIRDAASGSSMERYATRRSLK